MRFYFINSDEKLTKPALQGGCGVTDRELLAITVWQKNDAYQFELHLQNHGPYVYIFPDGRRAGQKDMPRYSFGGGRIGMFDNDESLSSAVKTDVQAVVDNNRDLFAAIHSRFYGHGDVAKKMADTDSGPRHAYFSCFAPGCANRNKLVKVAFPSASVMRKEIKVSHFGGIHHMEYPLIRCPRKQCSIGMELVETIDEPDASNVVKDVIEFAP